LHLAWLPAFNKFKAKGILPFKEQELSKPALPGTPGRTH